MAARDRAANRDEAEREQNPMGTVQPSKKAIGPRGRPPLKLAVENKWLDNEQGDSEEHPDEDHRVHPPKFGGAKPIPEMGLRYHVEPGNADDNDRYSSLPHEPALDALEGRKPIIAKISAPDCRQYGRGYHSDAANPYHHPQDMQNAGERRSIHDRLDP
jgi:hypothetical protein